MKDRALRKEKYQEENIVEEPGQGTIEKGLKTLWIIWSAMFGSLFIYVIICHLMGSEIQKTVSTDFPLDIIEPLFYIIATSTLILACILRMLILRGRHLYSKQVSIKPPVESIQTKVLAKYTTVMIISLALAESIGIYGLILFFLGGTIETLYIFIITSGIAMIFFRPKKEVLQNMAINIQANEEAKQ